MRRKFNKYYNSIIAALLAILGFSGACSDHVDEYGSPSAKFIIKGKVLSVKIEKPISNIRISMQEDTTYSDTEGNYEVIDRWGFPTDYIYTVQFRDIDGTVNGEYEPLDTLIEFINPTFTGGDGNWYQGETEKTLDVKLNSKE